jgi:hypothetical protein
MTDKFPSSTAMRVIYRAAHLILDEPRIFEDTPALRLASLEEVSVCNRNRRWLDDFLSLQYDILCLFRNTAQQE